MPTVITTPGASNANSYASVAEADAYHDTRLQTTTWDAADADAKAKAVISATRLLDASPYAWTGAAAVAGTQALGWPRTGMLDRNGAAIPSSGATSIPQALKDATSEFARQLIDKDRAADNQVANSGLNRLKAGPIELGFKDEFSRFDASLAVVPDVVLALLVSSWLLEPQDPDLADPELDVLL